MTGREGQGIKDWEELLFAYGRCVYCGAPRKPVMFHNGVEVTEPPTMSEAREIGGHWEHLLVCLQGHRQP